MKIGDVVQFNENHKWCGCLGIIDEIKPIHNTDLGGELPNDYKFMIGVPIPEKGISYMYVLASEFAIEYIGKANLVSKDSEDDEKL